MKRNLLIAMMLVATAGFAAAQTYGPTGAGGPSTDVLGAHLNYGRGCPACHAPHSGAAGNGGNKLGGTPSADTGSVALWGEDASPLYGATLTFAGKSETLPTGLNGASATVGGPSQNSDVSGILMCLSCHDGNVAEGAMMKNMIYENPGANYGGRAIPTLLGNNGVSGGGDPSYLTDHPVGINTIVPCGGAANHAWDCSYSSTGGIIPGPLMQKFITNYGFFVSPGKYNNQPEVTCTTCHNQHLMNVVAVGGVNYTPTAGTGPNTATVSSGATGLAAGNYITMFFIRAPYNPATTTAYSNQNAQFCRQCHGGESNEWVGGTAVTTF